MSNAEKRDALVKKGIDPQIMQIILLDELNGRLEEQSNLQREANDRARAISTLNAPPKRPFPPQFIYQYKTLRAGESGQIYLLRNPQPDLLVGIITRMANLRYQNTILEQFIDYNPKRIEYVTAEIHNPTKVNIPFHEQVEWIAHNLDVKTHPFEVFCDGYFIPLKDYNNL
jgi:hypothetical protein